MQADPNPLPPYFALIVPTVVIGIFCSVSYLSSLLTGWHKLAEGFRAPAEPYGVTKSAGPLFYTVYMRYWAHYSSCIRMTAAGDGLYLSILFFLRIGHPTLCIPWNEVQIRRTKYFWMPYVLLTLGHQEQIPMRISLRMAEKLGILERIPGGQ